MAHTLKPDPSFQRFNKAKELQGHYFRFTTRSAVFNLIFMGLVPAGLTYFAYSNDGQLAWSRRFRKDKVLHGEEYEPRLKDL